MISGKNPTTVLVDEHGIEYVPARGDVIMIDAYPNGEVKRRPVLVLSAFEFNNWGTTATVVPVTQTIRNRPFEVPMTGTETTGAALADLINTIDYRSRNAAFIEKAPDEVLDEVLERIAAIVDL